jgi:predicted PurR-regulated permease PerM
MCVVAPIGGRRPRRRTIRARGGRHSRPMETQRSPIPEGRMPRVAACHHACMTERHDVQLRIPFTTLLKIAFFALLVIIVIRLWSVLLMLVVAALIAVVLAPLVRWLERRGLRRGLAITIVALLQFGALLLLVGVVVPTTANELRDLSKNAPQIRKDLYLRIPYLQQILNEGGQTQWRDWLLRGAVAGKFALEGLTAVLFVLAVAIYLLIEGERTLEWLLAFAPKRNRQRLHQTVDEASEVMRAYVRGNFFTSTICAVWLLITLLVLHVPAAVPLAVFAFFCDFVPVVGTIVMTVPAALLALTVSPTRALLLVASVAVYHLLENYFLAPRIYGKTMELSTLAVLLAVTVGGVLQGVMGAVLILPFVAAYPIIERIWLREQLPDDTTQIHEAIEEA